MTDIETKLRDGFSAFAADTEAIASAPAVATIELRARTPEPKHRRWPKLTVVIAGGALVTTGLASATGVLPGPVESRLREFRSWGYDANLGASKMASVTDGDMTYELWRAPLGNGGRGDGGLCVYERAIGPNGDIDHGGSAECGPGTGLWSYPERTGPRQVASGQIPPGATRIVFTFEDGTTFTVEPQKDRYFITTFQGVPDGSLIVKVQPEDAEGDVVNSQ